MSVTKVNRDNGIIFPWEDEEGFVKLYVERLS